MVFFHLIRGGNFLDSLVLNLQVSRITLPRPLQVTFSFCDGRKLSILNDMPERKVIQCDCEWTLNSPQGEADLLKHRKIHADDIHPEMNLSVEDLRKYLKPARIKGQAQSGNSII